MSSSYLPILLLFFAFCNRLATGRVGATTRIVGGTEVEPGKYPYFGKGHAEMEGQ
jgi:secreted trypsin-like serine protease